MSVKLTHTRTHTTCTRRRTDRTPVHKSSFRLCATRTVWPSPPPKEDANDSEKKKNNIQTKDFHVFVLSMKRKMFDTDSITIWRKAARDVAVNVQSDVSACLFVCACMRCPPFPNKCNKSKIDWPFRSLLRLYLPMVMVVCARVCVYASARSECVCMPYEMETDLKLLAKFLEHVLCASHGISSVFRRRLDDTHTHTHTQTLARVESTANFRTSIIL